MVGGTKTDELKGVQYAVFGCGDHNWASTYQRIPRYIDEQMAQKGATRFSKRGEADASGDFEEQLEQWKQSMWSDAMKAFGLELNKNMEKERSTLSLQFVSRLGGSPLARTYEAVYASILENRELNHPAVIEVHDISRYPCQKALHIKKETTLECQLIARKISTEF